MGSEHAMSHGWDDWCGHGRGFDPAWLRSKLSGLFAMTGGPGFGPGGGRGPGGRGPGGRGPGGRGHGGHHGPGPFGFGGHGPFGRMFGHGWGPPWMQGPKARRGDVRLAILALLSEGPRNGYQIIQEVQERSGGAWKPSPGAVYPALQQLADEGLVRAEESEGRRTFSLTEDGERYVTEHREEIDRVFAAMSPEMPSDVSGLFNLIAQSGSALAQIVQTGTDQQREQARVVLDDTRKRLYRILAEDDISEGGTDDEPGR